MNGSSCLGWSSILTWMTEFGVKTLFIPKLSLEVGLLLVEPVCDILTTMILLSVVELRALVTNFTTVGVWLPLGVLGLVPGVIITYFCWLPAEDKGMRKDDWKVGVLTGFADGDCWRIIWVRGCKKQVYNITFKPQI